MDAAALVAVLDEVLVWFATLDEVVEDGVEMIALVCLSSLAWLVSLVEFAGWGVDDGFSEL